MKSGENSPLEKDHLIKVVKGTGVVILASKSWLIQSSASKIIFEVLENIVVDYQKYCDSLEKSMEPKTMIKKNDKPTPSELSSFFAL